jgi:hypothetical protein
MRNSPKWKGAWEKRTKKESPTFSSQMLTILIILISLESIGFLSASVLHFGIPVFGYTESRTISEAIIQGSIGIAFVVSAFGIWKQATWGRKTAVGFHIIALAGALFGFAENENQLNLYNLIRLVAMVTALILLFSPMVKALFEKTRMRKGMIKTPKHRVHGKN